MARLRAPHAQYVVLWVLGAAISVFTIRRGLEPFDEGLVLQAGRRVLDGQVPYGDFRWSYGPLDPYALAAWFETFGVSVLPWRLLRVAVDASVALTVYALIRREVPPWLALAGWGCAACAMAQPTSANPFAPALLLCLLAVLAATSFEELPRRAALLAGLLIGVAAAWRLDFAVYGAAGAFTALALRSRSWREPAAFAGSALVAGLVLYAPFLILAGPGTVWEELIGVSLRERDYWTLPFPLSYDGDLRLAHLAKDGKDLLGFYVPVLLVLGVAVAGAAVVMGRLQARAAGLAVLGLGCLSYLVSRADEFHATPLIVVLAALLPLAIAAAGTRRALALAAAGVLALLLLHGVLNRTSALLRPEAAEAVDVDAAAGARVPPAEAMALERTVREVRRLVPPGGAIYVLPQRSDLVRIGNPLIYVLAERENPTDRDFGLLSRRKEQREAIAALERERPAALVRWTDPKSSRPEPNERGKPSGVVILDDYVAANYSLVARNGYYDVLVPR
ncbi:MAG: glycosyltransferase family 39 protein [Thermoleophilaceae bacterium]|nr:glycosyltransferase family 39 protein [Thermoleophilaceae bacterium]